MGEAAFARDAKTAYDHGYCSNYSSDNDDTDSESETESV